MKTLLERAKKVMPGGVNSPVRTFNAVGRDPAFIKSAAGSKIYDTEGKEYIDYVCSWGPMILGHNNERIAQSIAEAVKDGVSFGACTEREVIMAELVTSMVPNIDMVRMVNSGTEAVMSALRLARGFTGKAKIIKFEGCYHGHSDGMLVSAGSGVLTLSNPDSKGVTPSQAKDTLIAQYNDIHSVKALFDANKDEIAAVIVEPVAANMGVVPPGKGFLEDLRNICDDSGSLLIFDEVITGFRLASGGGQQYFGINADMVTFAKIIGGGMPVGAYGARKEIMEHVAPLGGVYQAGTLSGNPVAMAAGIAQLEILKSNPEIYGKIADSAEILAKSLREAVKELDAPICVNQIGSLLCCFFTREKVVDFKSAKTSNTQLYAEYFRRMLDRGIYLAPAQFEAMFVSSSHSTDDLAGTAEAAYESLKEMKGEGLF